MCAPISLAPGPRRSPVRRPRFFFVFFALPQSEKKFYLDQAKKLKDNFNSKYPDYVYRRRPNNSRKKRKAEPALDDAGDPALGDPDDPAYEDTSPIDPDDALMVPSPQDAQYTRAHAAALAPSPPVYHPHDAVAPPAGGIETGSAAAAANIEDASAAASASAAQNSGQDQTGLDWLLSGVSRATAAGSDDSVQDTAVPRWLRARPEALQAISDSKSTAQV